MTRASRVLAVLLACAATAVFQAGPSAADIPNDPSAQGFIGFCDRDNHSITSGNVHDTPFVWKAVASVRPPASVVGPGQNAVLNIYQPRPDVAPGDWSGDQLTGASFYQQPDAPAVQATKKDIPLSVVVNEFPPLVDGLYQLRMYYGRADASLYSATYPATTIRVVGDRWSVVRGGTVNCAAAGAQSLEVLSGSLTVQEAYGSPLASPHGSPSSAPLTQASAATTSSTAPAGRTPASSAATVPVAGRAARTSGGTSWLPWTLPPIAALALGAVWWRRRSPTR